MNTNELHGGVTAAQAAAGRGTQAAQAARPWVLWRRVSTKQQGDSGLGLEAQTEMARYCMKSEPAEVYTDIYTGTKLNECVNLWAAIERCRESGEMLVIAKTDRFRNVKEALEILDAVGEGNLSFCDLPTTDRMVLTIIFAVWERQAMMGRINTRLALAERKKEVERNGHWISRAGNVCTHLGNAEGCDMDKAHAAAYDAARKRKAEWKENSAAYKLVRRKLLDGWTPERIVREVDEHEADNAGQYLTRTGKRVNEAIVRSWKRDIMGAAMLCA